MRPAPTPGASARAALAAGVATLALLACASAAPAAPDLVVDSLVVAPDSGPNGTTVQITAGIRNQGDSDAGASVTRIRINQDSGTVGPSDPQVCNLQTPVVAVGATVEVACSPKLTERPAGANYIWAIADVNKEIGQEVTSNDRASALFTVDGDPSDLVVDDLVVDPTEAANGEDVTITVTIRNQGEGDALASTTRIRINQDADVLSTSDAQICNIATPAVPAGESVEVECTETLASRPPGTNYIWAIADVNRTAGQSDTTNDRANTPVEISAEASDLVIDGILLDPASGRNGDPVSVTVTIRNQGTRSAFSSITRIRMNQNPDAVSGADPQICLPIDTPQIAAGGSTQVKCKAEFEGRPTGLNYVWAIADASETAGQSDRTNDRARAEFVVDPPPVCDLAVRSVSLNPTSGLNGKSVTVTVRIGNDGEASSPSTKTRIFINTDPEGIAEGDTVLCEQISTVALSSGANVQVSCKPVVTDRPFGINRIWAVVDANGESGQQNLSNDRLSAAYTVLAPPSPDLVVESVAVEPPAAELGAQVSILARIRNQGTEPAAASTARLRLGGSGDALLETDPVVCDTLPTPTLAVGAAADVACNWTVGGRAPGPAFVWAVADVADTAGQADRSNDTGSTAFEVLVPDAPNLTVRRLVVRPNVARNGETVIVKARVVNVGTQAAAASVTTMRINDDAGATGEGDDVLCAAVATPALAPGESVRARCRAPVVDRPLGPNSIWAVVDTTGSAGQLDPSDDHRRVPITIVDSLCSDSSAEPEFAWPVEQPRVLQDYASYGSVPLAGGRLGYHSGLDLVSHLPIAPHLTPVYAAADGEVVAIRRNCPSPADPEVNPPSGRCAGGWGNYVVLRHGAGIYSVYAHLAAVFATSGCVTQGERIAIMGSSGSTTIPVHLHFDVLADLVEPVARKSFGNQYYRTRHPLVGRVPENDDGALQVHLDPRDFMARDRIRITQATTASRGAVTGGAPAYLAAAQEFISYGELVPGFYAIDLPLGTSPEDGPPYADDVRYGWVPASNVDVVAGEPGAARIDGYGLFVDDGVGANFVTIRSAASSAAAEVSKAWGDQQFAATGSPVAEPVSGRLWQPVDVPGTAPSGAAGPREAFVPADSLGSPPAH